MKVLPVFLTTLVRLLRRDGWAFFRKCARYGVSPDAWLWLLRGGKGPTGGNRGGNMAAPPAPSPEERARSRRILAQYAPKVSVVVASYNYAHLLRETLDALAAQTYRNFEVLVVDDGSSDESVDIIREYSEKDPRFSLLRHEGGVNKGLPSTVKLGVETATGEFVAFCEADDLWTPDHLEKKIDLLREHWGEPDLIVNDFELFGNAERCREVAGWMETRAPALANERNRISPLEFRRRNWICTFSICMVRRSVLLACDLLSVPRPANLDWWLWRQICFDNDIWCVHEKLTKWRLHKDSFLMRDGSADRLADESDMIAAMDRFLVDRHPARTDELRSLLRPEDRFSCRGGRLRSAGGETDQPGFSVVLLVDAPADAVRRSLDSLARQTYRQFELLPASGFGGVDPDPATLAEWLENAGLQTQARLVRSNPLPSSEEAFRLAERDWVVGLLPGDVLRPDALQVFAARIVLEPSAAGICASTRCTHSGRVFGHSFQTEKKGSGPFACLGSFALRRDGGGGHGAPFPSLPFFHPELGLLVRLFASHPLVFPNHIVLLHDDSPGGADPDNRRLDESAAEFFLSARARQPLPPPSSRDTALVRSSTWFDRHWYLRENPDVAWRRGNPAQHYAQHGGAYANRNPGPDFVGDEYLALNPDVRMAGVNPLVHFERNGKAEGRAVSSLQERRTPVPENAIETDVEFPPSGKRPHRRTAVFAAYFPTGRIPETTLLYLRALREVCDEIVLVANGPVLPGETEKLRGLVRAARLRRHTGYDFFSWRLGIAWARSLGLLDAATADELVLANDSCYGPALPFPPAFSSMENRPCDFWGMTANKGFVGVPHIQSYFVVFRRRVLDDAAFDAFFDAVEPIGNRWHVIVRYEAGLTRALERAGFSWETLAPRAFVDQHRVMPTKRPLALMRDFGVPVVKAKALAGDMADDRRAVLAFIQKSNPALAAAIPPAPPPRDYGALPRLREQLWDSFAEKAARIADKAKKGIPLQARFLVSSASMFPARPLFDAMRRDKAFDARIFVIPDMRGLSREPSVGRQACRTALGRDYPPECFVEGEPDDLGLWPDILEDADIVCFPSPYDLSCFRFNPHYAVGRNFLPIHVNYGFYRSLYDRELMERQNYAYFWKAFFECGATAGEYAAHSLLKGANAEVVGYVKMDALATAEPWPRNGNRKRVLIAPHHSVEGGANDTLSLSNFQRYADFFLALPARHPELDFVFRPHPFLFAILSHPAKWGRTRVEDWTARMKAHPNVRWNDEGDYFPAFASCDAIVQDCGSYLVEWFYTGKPCCYMLKAPSDIEAKFAPLGRECLSHCSLAYNEADIEAFLRDVVENGNDPKAAARETFRKTVMVNYPHAADAALAAIKRDLGME